MTEVMDMPRLGGGSKEGKVRRKGCPQPTEEDVIDGYPVMSFADPETLQVSSFAMLLPGLLSAELCLG